MISTPKKLLVPATGRLVLLDFDEIDWIEARGNYCVLHLREQQFRMRSTIKDLLAKLPASQFMRVHRSAVVNLARIREVSTNATGRHEIVVVSGERIPLSREHWRSLKLDLLQVEEEPQRLAS